jgi:formate hydrogenlyase subunit 4
MTMLLVSCHLVVLLVMPILLVGLINRTKALWAGRRGPPLLQTAYDAARLLRKQSVYSSVTTAVFQSGAMVVLVTSLAAGLFSPLLGAFAPLSFAYDFVAFAYTLGLGRVMLMLSAMDAGSSFEGMGASREAWFAILAEPALFALLGAAAIATGTTSFAALLGGLHHAPHFIWMVVPAVVALVILLQTEAGRVPVDDPLTHLELTMIHEVMILDHSGPDLAAMQVAAALKLTVYAGMIAALLNPYDPATQWLPSAAACVVIMSSVAVLVGTIESLVARLRMKWVPRYVLGAGVAAGLAFAALSLGGGAP